MCQLTATLLPTYFNRMSEQPINKEIAILSLMQDIHKLLGTDAALASSVAEKLDTLEAGRNLRKMLVTRRADQPYYNERSGLALKPILDSIIETRNAYELRLADNPRLTVRTLYLKVYQAWLWLIDNHTDRDKYAQLKAECQIQQRPNSGVRIIYRVGAIVGSAVLPELDDLNKLQNKITKFIEEPIETDKMFEQDKLSLNPEQIELLSTSLRSIPDVRFNITASKVKILRFAPK